MSPSETFNNQGAHKEMQKCDANNNNNKHICISIDSHLYVAHRLKRREDQHKSKAEDQHVQKRSIYHDCGVMSRNEK